MALLDSSLTCASCASSSCSDTSRAAIFLLPSMMRRSSTCRLMSAFATSRSSSASFCTHATHRPTSTHDGGRTEARQIRQQTATDAAMGNIINIKNITRHRTTSHNIAQANRRCRWTRTFDSAA